MWEETAKENSALERIKQEENCCLEYISAVWEDSFITADFN